MSVRVEKDGAKGSSEREKENSAVVKEGVGPA